MDHVGILFEMTEVQFQHRPLRHRSFTGALVSERRWRDGSSSPPKRLVDLGGDIASRQAKVMQIVLRPPRQFVAGLVALAPDLDHLTEPAPNAGRMMICH